MHCPAGKSSENYLLQGTAASEIQDETQTSSQNEHVGRDFSSWSYKRSYIQWNTDSNTFCPYIGDWTTSILENLLSIWSQVSTE